MTDVDVVELETATRIFMEPPTVISAQQRQTAENVIMNFRRRKTPFVLCQQILEKSPVDLLLFEAADVIKKALIVEWDDLQEQDKLGLRQYLLNYVLHRQLQPYVREKLLQVIAIMIKRVSIVDSGKQARSILEDMEKLLNTGDIQQRLLVCRIILAIMQEYAITVKSDDHGLTFAEHFKAKKQFELLHLRNVFDMILNAIETIQNGLDMKNEMHANLLLEFLKIQEQILMWGYVSPLLPKRLIGIFEAVSKTDPCPSLRLNIQWEQVMLNPRVIEIFFGIYWMVREIPELQQKGLTCLVQLSTLNGTIFCNPQARIEYIIRYFTKFLNLLSSIQVKDVEAIGFATIFRKTLLYHPPNKNLPANMVSSMLQHMFALCCTYADASVHEESSNPDDAVYSEALEKILEAWLLVLQGKEFFSREAIQEYSTQIFNKYLQCHLSAPHGIRNPSNANPVSYDLDDTDQNDREQYREQLIIIGHLARENPGHSLNILSKLLEERTRQLRGVLEAMATGSHQLNVSNQAITETLYEDLHWIVLIAGHVIAMESNGEQPLVPADIMIYSGEQLTNGAVDLPTTLKVLAAPGQDITEIPNGDALCDNLVRLVAAIFRLCEIENKAMAHKMSEFLSPQLISSVMWFLNMFSEAYLFMLAENYSQINETFQTAFGLNTPGGTWTLNFMLHKICVNVQHLFTEQQVVADSIVLFVTLVKRKHKCEPVFNSEHFHQIVQLKSLPIPNATLIKGLVMTSACITDKEMRVQFLTQILLPIQERFNVLQWQYAMDSNNFAGKTIVATPLSRILDEVKAAIVGGAQSTAQHMYEIFEPIFCNFADLMNLFHNYQVVIIQLLQVLHQVVLNLSYLSNHKIYEICMSCIRTYVKHNSSRITTDTTAEDDTLEDLMLILNIMNGLLSRNYFDIDGNDEDDQPINAGSVCIFGLQYIIPLITLDLLKYPTFCCKYYQLITFFVETKAYKMCSLDPELVSSMLQSVDLGLRSFGVEVQSTCLEFIQTLASTIYFDRNRQSFMSNAMSPFFQLILEMLLRNEIDHDNRTECSSALFHLLCCYKEHYVQIVQAILSSIPSRENAEKLSKEFEALTNNFDLVNNRIKQSQFSERFEKFVVNISFMHDY